jgi:hypothetical protein
VVFRKGKTTREIKKKEMTEISKEKRKKKKKLN